MVSAANQDAYGNPGWGRESVDNGVEPAATAPAGETRTKPEATGNPGAIGHGRTVRPGPDRLSGIR